MTELDNIPTFFNAARLTEFWGYIRFFLRQAMPLIMIVVALVVAEMATGAITNIFRKKNRKDDEDDEVYYI